MAHKIGIIFTHRAGWKSVRKRIKNLLPLVAEEETYAFYSMEDHAKTLRSITDRLGRMSLVTWALEGYLSSEAAIRDGCERIMIATNQYAIRLPKDSKVKYYIYGDSTARQLGAHHEPMSRKALWLYDNGIRRLADGGHRFLCMSRWYANALMSEHQVDASQIDIIPSGIDTDYWSPDEGAIPVGNRLKVVFVATNMRMKGGDVLIKLAQLPEFARCEWHIVTKDPMGPEFGSVFYHTKFNPDESGLRDLVRSCDLFVLPTRADCLPNAAIEACACGLPAIITDIGATSEIVEHGRTGTLLNEVSEQAVAAAIRQYLESPELLVSHGKAAREKICREFAIGGIMSRLRTILNA